MLWWIVGVAIAFLTGFSLGWLSKTVYFYEDENSPLAILDNEISGRVENVEASVEALKSELTGNLRHFAESIKELQDSKGDVDGIDVIIPSMQVNLPSELLQRLVSKELKSLKIEERLIKQIGGGEN